MNGSKGASAIPAPTWPTPATLWAIPILNECNECNTFIN
jgi:hypothetical protein